MDALDLRILATMGYVPWGPTGQDVDRLRPSTVADELGVTPETVRDRVDGMEEDGVVASWQAYPHPDHLGLELGGWAFNPPSREVVREALDDVLLADGVLEALTYRGPFVALALAYEDAKQRDRRLSLLSRRLEDPDPVHVLDPPLPDVDRELDATDWAIVAALRGQARRPLSEVADEVSTSYRTVKRRFDAMIDEGSLYVVPRVDLSRVSGVLPFTLAMFTDDPPREVANRAHEAFGEKLLHRLVPPDDEAPLLVVGAFADTVADVEATAERAEAIDGVGRARALFSAGRRETGWLDERIRARRARA